MTPITIHLILKNRKYPNLRKTLQSLKPLEAEIIGVILSEDLESKQILEEENVASISMGEISDYSKLRNAIVQQSSNDWQMYIEPWETLTNASKILGAIETDHNVFNLMILQKDIVSKQVRLWKKNTGLKFTNRVYETLIYDAAKNLDCVINCNPLSWDKIEDNTYKIVEQWVKDCPTNSQAYYYKAFCHLELKEYREFVNMSEAYLLREQSADMATILMKYYRAMVGCYVFKEGESSIRHVLGCLTLKPLMAEFWCLLGDICYSVLKDYPKAQTFYKNALILGSRRDMDDNWPIEIAKYRDYPTRMIANCQNIRDLTKVYISH